MKFIQLVSIFIIGFGMISCGSNADPDPQSMDIQLVESDLVAHRLVTQDPSLLLVDVSSPERFDAFTLPEAMNIPLESKNFQDELQELDPKKFDIIFFAQEEENALKAWQISKKLGFSNSYILEGGIKGWQEAILSPQPPEQSASAAEWEQYEFRKAASLYFAGESVAFEPSPYIPPQPKVKKVVQLKPKKKVVEEEEGC